METTIDVPCDQCGKTIAKVKSEYKRSVRLGRHFFCNSSCAASHTNARVTRGGWEKHPDTGRQRDDLSPFRYFTKIVKIRASETDRKRNEIDEAYLKEVWDKQHGICPYTGWSLVLPESSQGWKSPQQTNRASLDRMDCSKGYIKENLQFISVMANYAKNNFSNEELLDFCRAVASNSR